MFESVALEAANLVVVESQQTQFAETAQGSGPYPGQLILRQNTGGGSSATGYCGLDEV